MPECKGRWRFAPPLNAQGSRVRRDGTTTDWWLIIECDRDLGKYLRHLYSVANPAREPLSDPLWGAHVSVVQGEVPVNIDRWCDREDKVVTLEYLQEPKQYGEYVVLPVVCEEALNYRESLGLSRDPQWPLHLTVGNSK